jgi:SAM-dependent methyltransferase/uncharacterized protein YbaR (Trm112 family)
MDEIPVCNYEGSDYQTSFWEQGGRAYEDAVEKVALRRLMPSGGKHLLELGAGAGRNTPRYKGFQQITLLDYSLTQLQQARERLGLTSPEGAQLRYVSADIYHLPFASGSFDAATMIRTLHHMVDPRLALSEVRRSLQDGAVFVLEFANKQNLKSVLRYLLGRQVWNPFSPEPIEFVPLNFDFHPATVRAWLQVTGFAVNRQLTVSHFRMGFLKRWVPLSLLVQADALAQYTGNLWQLTPSVFVGCTARPNAQASLASETAASANEPGESNLFRCPACGNTPLPERDGELVCPACERHYPIIDGIYDLRVNVPARES